MDKSKFLQTRELVMRLTKKPLTSLKSHQKLSLSHNLLDDRRIRGKESEVVNLEIKGMRPMEMMQIDTPALLIDRDIMMDNLKEMQTYADKEKVKLRPHIKTHKMPQLAKLQEELGAEGITVAKIGEAEVMAKHGLKDIFIANQIVGDIKLKRIRKLAETIDISFGIDSLEHVQAIEKVFAKSHKKAQILIEIEVGENRSGVIEMKDFQQLLDAIKKSDHVAFKGIFSHEGHAYKAD